MRDATCKHIDVATRVVPEGSGSVGVAPSAEGRRTLVLDLTPRRGDLEPIETASRDEIAALQLARLKRTLRHVYDNVAHYRAAFDAAGARPDDLRTLADLAKFPFTTKSDLRANYPFGMFATPRDSIARVHASSGTTGKPTVVGYTKADIETWSQVVARSIRAAGGRPGMKLHNAYGYGLFTGGLGLHYGAERLGLTTIPVSGGMTERQVQLIADFEPDIITVTPSYMLAILDEFRRQGRDPRATSLKVGIFGAEPWTDAMRAEIEQTFDMHAVDIYGLSEVIGPGVASECVETKDGLTVWEDHFYPEIVDPGTAKPLPDGETGELVLTTLTKEAMPVIRYRTRDLTRLLPGTARSMRRMARIAGRSDDMLIVRGVNLFPTQIEEQILKVAGLAPHYQIVLTREGRLDEVEVLVEVASTGTAEEARKSSAAELGRRIKGLIGITARITVTDIGAIERSQGKARRVIDQRPKT
jgi:phenylacetate-CoA ligase